MRSCSEPLPKVTRTRVTNPAAAIFLRHRISPQFHALGENDGDGTVGEVICPGTGGFTSRERETQCAELREQRSHSSPPCRSRVVASRRFAAPEPATCTRR